MPIRRSEFNALRDFWYKKAEESGFEDHEHPDGRLKARSDRWVDIRRLRMQESNEAYFKLARQFLFDHTFIKERDRILWEYHVEGLSTREISKILKTVKIKLSKPQVARDLKRMKAIMKRMYFTSYE